MQLFRPKSYTEKLLQHYTRYFHTKGKRLELKDPVPGKLHPDFYVLEIPPGKIHSNIYVYCTVGMSCDRKDEHLIELFVYSPIPAKAVAEMLTWCASYHRNKLPLNLHHTVNIGQPWLGDSLCDHGFISLPYLEGLELEIFTPDDRKVHCYWFIPITEKERNYKIENGCEALEQLFEDHRFNYLNPGRACMLDKK